MPKTLRFVLSTFALALALPSFSQAPEPKPLPPRAQVTQVAWLQGHWEGQGMGGTIEDVCPDWVGWEDKDKAVMLTLTRIGPDEAAFGGVVFRRAAPDLLEVDLTIRTRDGSTRVEKLAFRKKPL